MRYFVGARPCVPESPCNQHIPQYRRINKFSQPHAESMLQQGQADLVALARELLWNPNWPMHVVREFDLPNYLELLPGGYSLVAETTR